MWCAGCGGSTEEKLLASWHHLISSHRGILNGRGLGQIESATPTQLHTPTLILILCIGIYHNIIAWSQQFLWGKLDCNICCQLVTQSVLCTVETWKQYFVTKCLDWDQGFSYTAEGLQLELSTELRKISDPPTWIGPSHLLTMFNPLVSIVSW